MRAQGIEVAGVEFEPSAWHQKRSRDPTRRKAYDAVTRRQRLEYEIAIGHRKSQCPLALALSSDWIVKPVYCQAIGWSSPSPAIPRAIPAIPESHPRSAPAPS